VNGWFRARKKELLLLPLDLYAAGMVAYLLFRLLSTRIYIWPIEVVSAYLHLLLLPAIPLLILAIVLKSRHTAILLGIGALAYAVLFGEMLLPHSTRSNPPDVITVMTYNTGNGVASWTDLETSIRESGADIVAIQESVAEEIPLYHRDLEGFYPYQVFHGSGLEGIGLLSRYPILHERLEYLASPRPYLVADLEIDNRVLTVINGHPPVMFGPGAGEDDGRGDFAMVGDLATGKKPAVILGDLNISDQNEGYSALMRPELTDVHRAVGIGLGLTYPRRFNSRWSTPIIRIDYILTTSDIEPVDIWLGDDGGSDHMPVLATLGWRGEG